MADGPQDRPRRWRKRLLPGINAALMAVFIGIVAQTTLSPDSPVGEPPTASAPAPSPAGIDVGARQPAPVLLPAPDDADEADDEGGEGSCEADAMARPDWAAALDPALVMLDWRAAFPEFRQEVELRDGPLRIAELDCVYTLMSLDAPLRYERIEPRPTEHRRGGP